ncbi:MAG: serine hydrolase domain-containing protein [Halioglobus sp.]
MERSGCRWFAVTCLLAMIAAPAWSTVDAGLQRSIQQILTEERLTGVAWSLVGERGSVTLGTAGYRDNLNKTAFSLDTKFHVGSVTKSLLALGVLRLTTEGLVDIDAPAENYLPDLKFENRWHASSRVSVRHLLDHTAGMDDARLWQIFSQRATSDEPLLSAFPDSQQLLRIRSQPGRQFSYSNMGYTLLGMVIEKVTGERYETYLDQNVLKPLGMLNSTFQYTTQVPGARWPMLAWGHVDDGSRYAAEPSFLRPAGQFTSTVSDLARYLQFLLGDGRIDGQVFIEPGLMRSRGRPAGTDAAKNGLVAGYALGLGRRDRHGVVGFCHGGNIVGFVAMLCAFPAEGKAFAYSVNTDNETADYGRIDALLIEALGIAASPQPESASPALDIDAWRGWYVLRPNRFETFEYLDTVFGALRVSGQPQVLSLTYLQQPSRQLRSVGGYSYSANDRSTTSHVFLRGKDGAYRLSDGFQSYQKVPTSYLVAHWLSVALGLIGLGWLLGIGLYSLLRYRSKFLSRVEAPAVSALLLLLVPVPFFLDQSFMALGDKTVASVLLALVTLLLPLGLVLTLQRVYLHYRTHLARLHGLAALFLLQWCVVLALAGLLPLRLWS